MEERLLLRELYGPVFVTILPDGQRVPWKPLSVGEFNYFEEQLSSGTYPTAFIENEIFKKCVLNPILVSNIDKLLAGSVSSVVFTILENSSPRNLTSLEYALARARSRANTILNDMVALVCQAFPAYKPEDLYAMDSDTFMLRVATAERKLLNIGLLKEPLSFTKDNQPARPAGKTTARLATPPPVNLAHKFEQQQQQPAVKQTIITKTDIREHNIAYTGHEVTDKIALESQMVENTAGIYEEYMKQVQEGKQLRIKTPEERKAEALNRAERNRKDNILRAQQIKEADEAETARLAKLRKVHRTVKKRRGVR